MQGQLQLSAQGYFETRGLNVLPFSNWYDGLFSDAKISGIEMIHHGVRTATNGDVRLSSTPGQWDQLPQLVERSLDRDRGSVAITLAYPHYNFRYTLTVESRGESVLLSIDLEQPVPQELVGRAGFNLEFLPAAYFSKAYLMDGRGGVFPRYPSGPTTLGTDGAIQPQPIQRGTTLVLAPEDISRRVQITSLAGDLLLFDGRNTAQNGWYVVRTLLPHGQAGRVVSWLLTASTIPGWLRPPVIAHSQVGYHPSQRKLAMIELDKHDERMPTARLLQVMETGDFVERLEGPTKPWGTYLRYNYAIFDFSEVVEEGLYVIEYSKVCTQAFRIAHDVYEHVWQPTLDVFFPVQMDHMFVREAHRVWHGLPHRDDARQAPVAHEHFDLYAQGPTTDTPFQPGDHIPGLDVGGWFDAGDFDIRTQTQYAVVLDLVHTWEAFRLDRDQTTIDQQRRSVAIHVPDGIPDLIQQIEHGTLALMAQFRAVGHALAGIVEPDLVQYTHLGDAASKTDNLIFNPKLAPGQSDGYSSGTPDDRWAFTSKSTPLNYGSIAALAAASRVLRDHNDELAAECLMTAQRVWQDEHQHAPDLFKHGNTTGNDLHAEELKAAVELLLCTSDRQYAERIAELWPAIEQNFAANAVVAVRALPYMPTAFVEQLRSRCQTYGQYLQQCVQANPFGVPISTGGWAGNGTIIRFAITNYLLHTAFPDLIDREFILGGLNYLYGCHPGSDISFVSGVGTVSKEVAYGNNRADFSFIAGGVVPGVLVIKPDFPENKEDWPFFWGQNEYVVNEASGYIFLVNAVNRLLNEA